MLDRTGARTMKWDPEGKPRKPDLLGIGAQKAGTTWLSQMLGQHPGIWTPPFKEVQFCNYLHIEEHREWLPWHFHRTKKNIRESWARKGRPMPAELADYLERMTRGEMFTKHWYKRVFSPAPEGTLAMDVTPEYSTLPEEGVEFVAKFLPRARFIYIIRHPVDRAMSQLRMNVRRLSRNPQSLDDWLAEAEDPVLVNRGDYATYVPRWSAHFGPDRLLYLPFGQIAADPLELLARVETFLGLPPYEDYRGAGNKVFSSQDGTAIPAEVRTRLHEKLAPQFAFLEQNFGTEFAAQLR